MSTTINPLDPSQRQVLQSLLSDNKQSNISIVYGPPGTGKSHLIVSLLFELATHKNKVLFVSQNTEALEVIRRMVENLERKDMKLDDEYLSLLDFCLFLNRSDQRKLNYIKNQSDRICYKKTLSPTSHANDCIARENESKILSYVYLDKDKNENLEGEVGTDELLANYLRNVHDMNMPGVTISRSSEIDAREVFSCLKNYEQDDAAFMEDNHPTSALRFVSKRNFKLTLPEVRGAVSQIISATRKIDDVSRTEIEAKSDIEVKSVLEAMINLVEPSRCLNLSKLQKDMVGPIVVARDIKDLVDCYKSLEEAKELDIPEEYNEIIIAPIVNLNSLTGENAVDGLEKCIKLVSKKIEAIEKCGDVSKHKLSILLSCALRMDFLKIHGLLGHFPNMASFDYAKVEQLYQDIEDWRKKNKIAQILPVAKSSTIAATKDNIKKKDVHELSEQIDKIKSLKRVLKDTTLTIADLDKKIIEAKKSKSALNPLRQIKAEDKESLTNGLLAVNEVVSSVLENNGDCTLGEIAKKCAQVQDDIRKYRQITDENEGVASQCATEAELIEQINRNIKNRERTKKYQSLIDKDGEYIKADAGDLEKFIKVAERAIEAIHDGNELARSLEVVSLSGCGDPAIKKASLEDLWTEITKSYDLDMFTKAFYEVKAGESLDKWNSRIRTLDDFDRAADFDNFIDHNRFIFTIKKLMGESNAGAIDRYLENESVGYQSFRERVTNDLVKAKFNNFPSEIRRGKPESYFASYQSNLMKERRNHFLDGLDTLRLATESSAMRLKDNREWRRGIPRMEQIRANSELIIDAFPIVIATPKEVARYLAPKKAMFDYVIFDEASQSLPGEALPSIYRAERVVIVGDPHQMPPTSLVSAFGDSRRNYDELDDEEDAMSILDIAIPLTDARNKYHLKVHYRSESNKLFEPSREAIYEEDNIRPIVEAQSSEMPIDIEDNLGPDNEQNFAEIIRHIERKLENDPKATFCLLFANKEGERGFRDYVGRNVVANDNVSKLMDSERMLTSTVTNCQGIEGDHTILFIGHYDSLIRMWFFNEKAGAYKRLNVSITRQRKSLTILMADQKGKWLATCQNIIDNPSSTPNRLKSARLMKSLLDNAGEEVDEEYLEKEYGPKADNIDSPLTQQLYDKLKNHYGSRNDVKIWCEVGWNMLIPDAEAKERNRRNVGYRLDIGIYSTKKKRFVLGIEMDGATYHSGYIKEFSDQQRQAILESKGWKIYRIWSTNWLNDTNKEFSDLVAEIDELLDDESSKN